MLVLALLIGLYSYSVLLLGLSHLLYFLPILLVTFAFIILFIFLNRKKISSFAMVLRLVKLKLSELLIIILLILLGVVNLIGALGPELSFDALWYHLTIPRLFVIHNNIYFIKTNLFYYSLMPKLTEMLYVSSLVLTNEIVAKLIHFSFGLFTCIILYQLCTLYLSRLRSLLVVLMFYSNLVVMWLSITAFSDLSRAFFEVFALYHFLIYTKDGKYKHLVISAFLLGLAICSKVLSIGTIGVFIILIFLLKNISFERKIKQVVIFVFISLLIPLPWFALAFFASGNPIYPLFSELALRNFTPDLLSILTFVKTFFGIFLFAPDPIGPLYIILFPLVVFTFKKLFKKYKSLILYTLLSYLVWYFTSQSGGSRFLAAYLPAYSLLIMLAVVEYRNKSIISITAILILIVACSSLIYRGVANKRYIPVIFGRESRQEFLMKNLNFTFGDFYDENSDIKKIVGAHTVLVENVHNLFYVDFPYVIPGWSNSTKPKYELVINPSKLEYKPNKILYRNYKTKAVLYKL